MVFKVAVSNRFQFKAVPSFRTMLFPKEGEIHYIGGADILPAPLDSREEARLIGLLGTEQEKEAKAALIEHNLRLVVYIAKKFDNTSVGVCREARTCAIAQPAWPRPAAHRAGSRPVRPRAAGSWPP